MDGHCIPRPRKPANVSSPASKNPSNCPRDDYLWFVPIRPLSHCVVLNICSLPTQNPLGYVETLSYKFMFGRSVKDCRDFLSRLSASKQTLDDLMASVVGLAVQSSVSLSKGKRSNSNRRLHMILNCTISQLPPKLSTFTWTTAEVRSEPRS